MAMSVCGCLKCGGTGIMVNGEKCDCGAEPRPLVLPVSMKVPMQYQSIRYNKEFIRSEFRANLGNFMEQLLTECTVKLHSFCKNYIICSPPNTGKTVWAYNLYSVMYSKGIIMPEIMDLMQVREILMNYYGDYREKNDLISNAKLMVIKIPMDLPNKFPETISTIIERRVRNDAYTIFLYNGSKNDLYRQDTFGKLMYLEGSGAFNTVCIKSFYASKEGA